MSSEIIFLSTCIIIIIVLFIFFLSNYTYEKYNKFVISNSARIQHLQKLNSDTKFIDNIKTNYYFRKTCKSKRQLDKFDIYEYFITLIEDDYEYFKNIYSTINQNIELYENYSIEYKLINTEANEEFCKSIKTTFKKFIKREDKLFKKLLLTPIVNVNFYLEAKYTSPAGRNSYNKANSYNFIEFKDTFECATNIILKKQNRQYQIKQERSRLTDSLRYDVLRRDNFRCQICGSSANDGVKLHVDHIIPVSKGGKTIRSNLRTLCDRCNIGKSDKIE